MEFQRAIGKTRNLRSLWNGDWTQLFLQEFWWLKCLRSVAIADRWRSAITIGAALAGNHFPLTTARLSAPDPKTSPSHIRTTSEPHPNHFRTTSEPHPNHVRATSEPRPNHIRTASEPYPKHWQKLREGGGVVSSRCTKPRSGSWLQYGWRTQMDQNGPLYAETGRIRFRGVRFQTSNSVSFSGLIELRGGSSVSSFQPIICV